MITHHFAQGLYAKETKIPAGTELTQHSHIFDHLSVLAKGYVVVTVDGLKTEHKGPCCLKIPADAKHSVLALTETTWYCIWPDEGGDPATIDERIPKHD